ncbi:hypothetical protein CYMTET_6365 [Cymbomonas tetramitiformis]|uniref:Uncharacterized protein n=1 Tax=Cymbomonas tetramitiformis TaxID=36881 RepID=A0AAE0GXB2_9CHLO|nr:hypothetical protein CYMTET_6365 [Cymbomonas tetramitiformis]
MARPGVVTTAQRGKGWNGCDIWRIPSGRVLLDLRNIELTARCATATVVARHNDQGSPGTENSLRHGVHAPTERPVYSQQAARVGTARFLRVMFRIPGACDLFLAGSKTCASSVARHKVGMRLQVYWKGDVLRMISTVE